jgi:radical SAM protein with 4Fe4S-binding SPASM domain
LGCKYCSEGHNPDMPDLAKIENSKTDVKTQDIINFISKIREKSNEKITISFWGGEPMMNMNYCLDLMLYYKDDTNINFFFYTNGTYIEKYKDSLKNINELLGRERLEIQISYDGKSINDIERLTKRNKSTSDDVKKAFDVLGEIGIKRKFKSTVTPRTFKYMFDSYLDLISIPGNDNYFPTPDSFNDYNKENEEQYFEDLKLSLSKIARHIYQNKLKPESFGWFRNNKSLCSAGINYFGINLDGKLSPCHSTMYDEHGTHEIGDIKDENINDILNKASEKFKNLLSNMNDDCSGCTALFCMKCPAGAFTVPSSVKNANYKLQDFTTNPSNLDEYSMRWTTKNINMCKVFKCNDIIYKALLKATNVKPVNSNNKRCELK